EDDLDYAWSLVNLGRAVEADGRYREALPLFQRALAIHVDAGVRASPGGAYALEALGACQFRMGRYERAASCFEDGIAIRRKVFGAEHLDTATLVHDLAIVRQNQGRSDEARALYDQAIAAKVTEVGREHPETAVTLHALAKLFLEQGLYDEARPLLVEAREIRERTLGKDHFLVATSIQDLALLDRDEGNLDAALAGLEKALDMRRKVFGDRHRQVGFSLHNLAEVLEARGDDAAAQRYFEEALAVRRAVLDAGHPHVAASLHGLGRVLWHRGDLEGARERLEQALAIREAVLLPEHPDRARNLHDLALLHADRGDFPAAWARAREAVSALEEHLQRVLWAQTESERFRFLESRHTALAILTSLAQRSGDPQAERIAYQAVLDWKGGATRAMLRGKARLEAGLDEGQRALLEDLRAAQAELSALMFSKDTAQRDTQVAALRDERARLELALNRSMGKQQADPAVDLDALRHALAAAAPDAAAVDFLVLSQYEPAAGADRAGAFGVPRLLVWTVRAGAEGVQRQDIGPADEVETLVRAFLEDLVARRGGEGLDGGDAGPNSNDVLRARLWDPLAAAIGPAGLVFLSPDSFLGGLPFETLQGGDTAYLIEDFAFVYQEDLVSLLTPPRARPQGHGLLAIGGVDYGRRAPGTVVSAARKYWPTLSATGPEADAVSQIHRDAFGAAEPRELLEGEAASEGVLKAALPEYEFLHLATHGYFEPEGLASMFERVVEDGRRVQRMRAPDRQLVRSLPGLLSGLICAGANLPVSGQGDDAYLTAEEVSWLPLTGVDTVVLSACETGLGRAQAGEGMLGLRRSFRMAGARTVISSLWEVRDAETGKLMQAYYRNLWLEGRGKLESLRAAQLEMLDENRRSKAGKGRPSTWGAFVLSGDWR
ncbi:MAG TPA: CHAT domain-containing tetratricopeptide repeat protein, partial [Planctomycetota bacterium]